MAFDLLEGAGVDTSSFLRDADFSKGRLMMVTPKEIDLVIERAAWLISMGINCALQKDMEPEDIAELVR